MSYFSQCGLLGFLMYRMELKEECIHKVLCSTCFFVPNVPYGVERADLGELLEDMGIPFLMYRMELKVHSADLMKACAPVPNVPYGVERLHSQAISLNLSLFLMYRMELKALRSSLSCFLFSCS